MSDILEQGEDDYKISLTKSTKLKLKVSILKIFPFLFCIIVSSQRELSSTKWIIRV